MRISDWSSYVCSSDLTAAYSQWNPYLPPQAQVSGTPRSPFRFHMVSADIFSQLLGVQLARLHTDKLPPKFNHSQTLLSQRIDRKSVLNGKRVSVRVALCGRRIFTHIKISNTQ